ncbi:hypothetical protein J2Z75_005289 [Rhizobium herbae]|uniref:Peptidase C39-like domain-containing protein n=1 Tax=Rhizobium herbae TaxID=508661 RepID=A0ABS4EUX9_9HYPH|nr:hypothetical protein [Rhizobium herbae]
MVWPLGENACSHAIVIQSHDRMEVVSDRLPNRDSIKQDIIDYPQQIWRVAGV